jgi:hypothetical protein
MACFSSGRVDRLEMVAAAAPCTRKNAEEQRDVEG